MKAVPCLGVCALAVLLGGCPDTPREVVYDLAARTTAAERWSSREVVLFGTPAAEPYQSDGFYREAPAAVGDTFVWSKAECEVALRFDLVAARLAVLDLAPFRGVRAQRVEVRLNDALVARFALNDARHRYRLDLPGALIFYLFEVVIVVTIQAYIFAALSAIYIGSAIEPEH